MAHLEVPFFVVVDGNSVRVVAVLEVVLRQQGQTILLLESKQENAVDQVLRIAAVVGQQGILGFECLGIVLEHPPLEVNLLFGGEGPEFLAALEAKHVGVYLLLRLVVVFSLE